MEDVLDLFEVSFPWTDDARESAASFLAPLEISDAGPPPRPVHAPAKREFVLGTGGALLVHILAAAALLLTPFLHGPRHTQNDFINVYFTEDGAGDRGPGAPDGPPGAKSGEEPVPQEVAPVPPVVKPVARPIPKPEVRRKPAPAARTRDTSEKSLAEPAVSVTKESAPPVPGNGAGEAEGAGGGKEPAEGPGGAGASGSTGGAGFSGEFEAAAVDRAPQILKKSEPVYPGRARSLGICGKVVVRFLVGPDGRVSKPRIIEAHPGGFFEQSTIDAVSRWQFKPGVFRGKDVATWVVLPVSYKLTGQEAED